LQDQTSSVAQEIRSDLKRMEKHTQKVIQDAERAASTSQEKDLASKSSEARIRQNMQNTMSRKFMDLMKEYQDVQTKYKDKYKDKVVRQYKIVNPEADQDEIDQVLASDQPVFAQSVLTGAASQAMSAVQDIQEKHKDILKLERSLEELHQLFVDMSVLVQSQGELLNQIEYSVEQSVAYVEKGVVELTKAQEYQKSARKVQRCSKAVHHTNAENAVHLLLPRHFVSHRHGNTRRGWGV